MIRGPNPMQGGWAWLFVRAIVCALAITCARPHQLQAQPLRVEPERPLTFGQLIPGLSFRVAPADPVRSGQATVFAPSNSRSVIVWFNLPAALEGSAAALLPLSFGASDGRYEISGTAATFDPRFPLTLPSAPRTTFNIGGTAQPTSSQRSGSYTGTIVLTVMRSDL